MTEYGTATLTRHADGAVTVDHADDVILVSVQLLREAHGIYSDGVLTLDTAGQYRYRWVRSYDYHSDVFERLQ